MDTATRYKAFVQQQGASTKRDSIYKPIAAIADGVQYTPVLFADTEGDGDGGEDIHEGRPRPTAQIAACMYCGLAIAAPARPMVCRQCAEKLNAWVPAPCWMDWVFCGGAIAVIAVVAVVAMCAK